MSRPLPYFQRAALVVANIEQSLKLYQDILGFRLEFIGIDDPDSYSYEVFEIDRSIQTRFATLSSDTQQRTLAFIEVPNQIIYTAGQMRVAATVIQVESVENTLEKVVTIGLKHGRIVRHDNPAKGLARLEAVVFDFDLHPIVLYSLL